MRKPRVRRQARERPTVGGDALRIVQCSEPRQQVSRTVEHGRGRGIQPGQRRRLISAPLREVERERREVGLDDLGRRLRREAALRALAPQAVAGPLGDASGAARALVGSGARDAPGLEAAHAGHRIEGRAAHQSRIDDRAHAGQRETGLGDVGGEDHTAAPSRIGLQGTRLFGRGQFAVQRQQHDRVIDLGHTPEHHERATDLARARQESEHIARALAQRALHGECEQPLGRLVTARQDRHRSAEVSDLHGIQTTRRRDHGHRRTRRAREQRGHRGAVERGRHHDDPQIGVERRTRIEAQCESRVGLQAALVELVEQHGRHALERWVRLQHAREHALGDHLDAGVRTDPCVEPHAMADRRAHPLPQRLGHALRHRTRSQPARLEHQDLATLHPWLIEQGERHHGALAGARRGLEHRCRTCSQRRP